MSLAHSLFPGKPFLNVPPSLDTLGQEPEVRFIMNRVSIFTHNNALEIHEFTMHKHDHTVSNKNIHLPIFVICVFRGYLWNHLSYTEAQNKPDTTKSVLISWCFISPKFLYYGVIGMAIGILIMHHLRFWPCILCLRYLHIAHWQSTKYTHLKIKKFGNYECLMTTIFGFL